MAEVEMRPMPDVVVASDAAGARRSETGLQK